jgi:uncharacterized Zn finger protein (UPF0148 family)
LTGYATVEFNGPVAREFMNDTESNIETVCPCCGARLTIDRKLGRVIGHEAPTRQRRAADAARLDRAADVLEKQAQQREAHFRDSTEQEKIKSDLLSRKFEEQLRKTRDQPSKPPLREIDLD